VAAGLRHPLISRRRPFDLICANILAAPLIALAHEMSAALRPGGVAILSGLLDGQAPEVGRRYDARGFSCLARESRLGWTTLTLMRRRMRPLERARGFTE
jgi:ribosomal protein L11 methyltransferase